MPVRRPPHADHIFGMVPELGDGLHFGGAGFVNSCFAWLDARQDCVAAHVSGQQQRSASPSAVIALDPVTTRTSCAATQLTCLVDGNPRTGRSRGAVQSSILKILKQNPLR